MKYLSVILVMVLVFCLAGCATTHFEKTPEGGMIIETSSFWKDITDASFSSSNTDGTITGGVGVSASSPMDELFNTIKAIEELRYGRPYQVQPPLAPPVEAPQ